MTDAAAGTPADDLELLRRHEPIVRYTHGESFFPMDVGSYAARASLNVRLDDGTAREVVPAGKLDLQRLGTIQAEAVPGRYFLRVAREWTAAELGAGRLLRDRTEQARGFRRGPGRLTRVGYLSRLVDALFSLALLLRGRVPGALARDAVNEYRAMAEGQSTHVYYGRVVREAGWIVLQYWFFYAYNDWRSGFHGANDHEADWEMMMVVLDGEADEQPASWAVYAQHDYNGADLRRRWDDRDQLELVDGHPVVYAGAGSHASYFLGGEYLTEHELALPTPIKAIAGAISRLFGSQGQQGRRERVLPIAFVDYARGDGVAIGPGEERTWDAVLLRDQGWLTAYRGLWGAHVRDPFEGEDAPAGPMYGRDGTVRSSWQDPLGFAELDLVPPSSVEPHVLARRAAEIEGRRPDLEQRITDLAERVAVTGAEQRALTVAVGDPESPSASLALLTTDQAELDALRAERAADDSRLAAITARLAALTAGEREGPSAHLRHIPKPTPPQAQRFGRLLEIWAAASIGLLLIGMILVLVFFPELGVIAAIVVIGVFLFIDAVLRGTVAEVVSITTFTLALVTMLILGITFWSQTLVVVAIVAGLFVIWQNLAELR